MRRMTFVLVAVLIGCFVFAGTGFAKGGAGGYSRGLGNNVASSGDRQLQRKKRQDRLMERLGITEEQKEEFKKVLNRYREQIQSITDELRRKRQLLWDKVREGNFKKGEAERLVEEISKLQKEIMLLRIRYMKQMRKILSEEQYREFVSLGAKRRFARKMRRGSAKQ